MQESPTDIVAVGVLDGGDGHVSQDYYSVIHGIGNSALKKEQELTTDALLSAVKQVEYYFSDENLPADNFLASMLDENLLAPIKVILGFNMMSQYVGMGMDEDALMDVILRTSDSICAERESNKVGRNVRSVKTVVSIKDLDLDISDPNVQRKVKNLLKGFPNLRKNTVARYYKGPKFKVLDVIFENEEKALEAFDIIKEHGWDGRSENIELKYNLFSEFIYHDNRCFCDECKVYRKQKQSMNTHLRGSSRDGVHNSGYFNYDSRNRHKHLQKRYKEYPQSVKSTGEKMLYAQHHISDGHLHEDRLMQKMGGGKKSYELNAQRSVHGQKSHFDKHLDQRGEDFNVYNGARGGRRHSHDRNNWKIQDVKPSGRRNRYSQEENRKGGYSNPTNENIPTPPLAKEVNEGHKTIPPSDRKASHASQEPKASFLEVAHKVTPKENRASHPYKKNRENTKNQTDRYHRTGHGNSNENPYSDEKRNQKDIVKKGTS